MSRLEDYAEYGEIYRYTNNIYFLLREKKFLLKKDKYCILGYLVRGFGIHNWPVDAFMFEHINNDRILDL